VPRVAFASQRGKMRVQKLTRFIVLFSVSPNALVFRRLLPMDCCAMGNNDLMNGFAACWIVQLEGGVGEAGCLANPATETSNQAGKAARLR
jgi:hypothetical protein